MRSPITRTFVVAVVLGCMALVINPGAAQAQRKIKIVFATAPTTLWLPYYVAQKKGWLNGLEIEESYVTGDSNAVRAVLSGQADFGAGVGTFSALSAVEAGAHLKAVGSWSPLPDYNLVISADKGATIADLAGKVIATSGPGALPDQLPRILMRKHHVDASTSRFVQVGGHPARMQAVLGGRADAALVNIVTSIDAIESGKVKVVARVAQEFPKLGYVWNVVREETIMDPAKAGIIQQLTTAGMNGSRFIMQSPDEAAAILNERIPSLALDLCKRVILGLNKDGVWGVDGGIDADVVDFTASTGKELGLLKRDVKTSEMTDTRFVDAAIKDPALSK